MLHYTLRRRKINVQDVPLRNTRARKCFIPYLYAIFVGYFAVCVLVEVDAFIVLLISWTMIKYGLYASYHTEWTLTLVA